jgi:hypothetical protein
MDGTKRLRLVAVEPLDPAILERTSKATVQPVRERCVLARPGREDAVLDDGVGQRWLLQQALQDRFD